LPTYIDLLCSCLTSISGLSWINLDPVAKTVIISTSMDVDVGVHKIVLVQSFANFAVVNPYTMFSLVIQPMPIVPIMRQPPVFSTALVPQTVQQCSDPTTKVWSFEFPAYSDPNNSPVIVSIALNNGFFTFDNTTMTVT
jgi:hypothetical protein